MVCKRLTTLPIIGSSVNLITMTRDEHKLPNKEYDMHARALTLTKVRKCDTYIRSSRETFPPPSIITTTPLPHKKDNAGTPLAHLFVASNNGAVIKTSPAGGLTWMPLCCPDAGYGNAAGFLNQGRYQRKAQPPAPPSESGSLLRFVVAPSRLPTRPPDLHPQQSGNRQKQKKKRGLGDKHGGLDTVNIAEV